MSIEWVETLRASGISDDKSSLELVSNAEVIPANTPQLVDMSVLRIVEVGGGDATDFLQGQFCNDLKQVSSTHAQITGYCTPKGRLLALPTIVGYEKGFRLLVHSDIVDTFLKRLRMFVMRSDVTLTEVTDWVCVGLIADEHGQLGEAGVQVGALPVGPLDAATSENRQILRWHDDFSADSSMDVPHAGRHRYISLASVADQSILWKASASALKRPYQSWRLADVSAGVPSVTTGVLEAFVPQMLNLQLINALSFTKGCYPGQEIVARMQYLGKLKRHMRLFTLSPADENPVPVPLAGDGLSTEDDDAAGVVLDAVRNSDSRVWILAVVKVSANASTFFLAEAALSSVNLPYPLPSLDESQADAG